MASASQPRKVGRMCIRATSLGRPSTPANAGAAFVLQESQFMDPGRAPAQPRTPCRWAEYATGPASRSAPTSPQPRAPPRPPRPALGRAAPPPRTPRAPHPASPVWLPPPPRPPPVDQAMFVPGALKLDCKSSVSPATRPLRRPPAPHFAFHLCWPPLPQRPPPCCQKQSSANLPDGKSLHFFGGWCAETNRQ